MGPLAFASSMLLVLVVVALVVLAAALALMFVLRRGLRRKNQVSPLEATEAPDRWALVPAGPGAGQHRRLQQIVREARSAAERAGGATYEVGDAAHDIESQAVDLDRQVVATSRMAAGAERAKRFYALDGQIKDLQEVGHKLTDLSMRFASRAGSPDATRERLSAIEASLSDLEAARSAADDELAALNRGLHDGVQAQMDAARRPAPEPATQPGTVDVGGAQAQTLPPTPRIRGRY